MTIEIKFYRFVQGHAEMTDETTGVSGLDRVTLPVGERYRRDLGGAETTAGQRETKRAVLSSRQYHYRFQCAATGVSLMRATIFAVTSGFALRYSIVAIVPCPSCSLSNDNQLPRFSITPRASAASMTLPS